MKKCYQILLMILCLLSTSVTACGNNRMESDTDFNTEAAQSLTIEEEETETDLWTDRMAGSGSAEMVYEWSATGWNSNNGYASYLSYYDDDYDLYKVDAFVQNYLQEQGIHKETPDGVSYNQNGDLFAEYYVDREKKQYCFIVHLWAEYSLDYKKG